MTPKEMAEAFKEAEKQGFIETLQEWDDCISECERCPASKSCEQLAVNGSYSTFKRNFKEQVLPLLK